MLDRRRFCLSSAALALAAGRAGAAVGAPEDARQKQVFDRFFATALDESPTLVTSLGLDVGERAGAKARLDDSSPAALARAKWRTAAQLAELSAIDRDRLSAPARLDHDAVAYGLSLADAANRRFAYGGEGAGGPYVISQINGAYAGVPDFLDSQHTIATRADCEAYLARLDAFARVMDEEVERVRHDAAIGVVPPDFAIDGAIAQMTVLRAPADRSTLVSSLATRAAAKHIAGDWAARASAVYERRVVPAIDRQIALMRELRPKAPHDAGVWRLPDGDAYYAASLKGSITTDASPDEVHRMGLDVTRELSARADTLFRRIGMTGGSVADRYRALFRDPRYLYPNDDAGKAREIADLNKLVQAMQRRLPEMFATLPRTPSRSGASPPRPRRAPRPTIPRAASTARGPASIGSTCATPPRRRSGTCRRRPSTRASPAITCS